MYLLVFVVAIIILWHFYMKKRFKYWTEKGFTQVNGSFPFGSMNGVSTKYTLVGILNNYYEKFKAKTDVLGLYNFLSPVLLAIDPEIIKDIFVRDFESFHDRGFFYNKVDDPVGANLFTLDGKEWKDRRIKLTPMFTSGKMKLMFNIINSNSVRLVQAVKDSLVDSKMQEMQIWSQRFTNDNIGNVAFGLDCNCINDENSEFLKYGKRFFDLSPLENLKLIFASEFPSIGKKLGFRFAPREVGDFFLKVFFQTIKHRKKAQIIRKDFVSLLLGLEDVYTSTELAAEAFIMYIGGFDTSSTLMAFTLYELALNQNVQNKLRDEIDSKLNENDMELTYDLIMDMKYLDMVVNETLRKYPPVPIIFRRATSDYKVSRTKLIIPKGTSIFINCHALQNDPEYFPNPDEFNPERFNEENIKNIKPYTFFPFGEGPRFCVGMRFGLMQSKIGIANLIRNFVFTPSSKTSVPLTFEPSKPLVYVPIGGMMLNVNTL